jgi:hypothetical protein
MIDWAALVFSVGQRAHETEESYISLTPISADLNAAPGTMPNSSIAYLTSTMHDG